jgi:hypothetical protein
MAISAASAEFVDAAARAAKTTKGFIIVLPQSMKYFAIG